MHILCSVRLQFCRRKFLPAVSSTVIVHIQSCTVNVTFSKNRFFVPFHFVLSVKSQHARPVPPPFGGLYCCLSVHVHRCVDLLAPGLHSARATCLLSRYAVFLTGNFVKCHCVQQVRDKDRGRVARIKCIGSARDTVPESFSLCYGPVLSEFVT